jgi:hypothetical protein
MEKPYEASPDEGMATMWTDFGGKLKISSLCLFSKSRSEGSDETLFGNQGFAEEEIRR